MSILEIETRAREQLVSITDRVEAVVRKSGVREGICVLRSLHTTAGLTVNEDADPSVARDMEKWLREAVPRDADWSHLEGNSDAHVKTSLMGPGETLIVSGGDLQLGRWQGVFLCEFDGPRTRRVAVRVVDTSV